MADKGKKDKAKEGKGEKKAEKKEEKKEEKKAEKKAEKKDEKKAEKKDQKDQKKDQKDDEKDEKGEEAEEEETKEKEPKKKPKSTQPKDEVGTRKGCRRYRWEIKDSNKEFWVMGHAEVKILSVGCLVAAMIMFTGTPIHPLITLILTMELSIFCFFFVIYSFAINRYLPFILWPISDILNDLFAFSFLVGALVFGVKIRQTMPMNYFIALILIGLAGLFALVDIGLQRKHFQDKKLKKNALVPPPGKEAEKPAAPGAAAGAEPGKPEAARAEAGKPAKAEKPAAAKPAKAEAAKPAAAAAAAAAAAGAGAAAKKGKK